MNTRYGQEVSILIPEKPSVVETRIRDVESWSSFLCEVESITKLSHARYDFEIGNGHGCRIARVAVHSDPRRHHFAWTSLTGPTFDGIVHLDEVNEGWTQVTIRLASLPDGFRAGLTDLAMPPVRRAGIDEGRLRMLLSGSDPHRQGV
jgi:hypothetical protein